MAKFQVGSLKLMENIKELSDNESSYKSIYGICGNRKIYLKTYKLSCWLLLLQMFGIHIDSDIKEFMKNLKEVCIFCTQIAVIHMLKVNDESSGRGNDIRLIQT